MEIWKYNGTAVSRISDVSAPLGTSPINLIVFKDKLLFSSDDDGVGSELWEFDGTFVTRVSDFNASADIGINLLEDLNLSKVYASPNKLFEYIHAGIPVLCSNTIENERILNKYQIGVSCINED